MMLHLVLPGLTMIHDISSEVDFADGTPPLQTWSFLTMGWIPRITSLWHFYTFLFIYTVLEDAVH